MALCFRQMESLARLYLINSTWKVTFIDLVQYFTQWHGDRFVLILFSIVHFLEEMNIFIIQIRIKDMTIFVCMNEFVLLCI